MTKSEARNKRRKEVVEAIIDRKEPVHLVARVFSIPTRTVFDWLALYRSGGWHALNDEKKPDDQKKCHQKICSGYMMQ